MRSVLMAQEGGFEGLVDEFQDDLGFWNDKGVGLLPREFRPRPIPPEDTLSFNTSLNGGGFAIGLVGFGVTFAF